MFHQHQFGIASIFEKMCAVLVLTERDRGDLISGYALAHAMKAYDERFDSVYEDVDALADQVAQQLKILHDNGRISIIVKADKTGSDETAVYYRIEDRGFFLH